MEQKLPSLLNDLRNAINDSLLSSTDVKAALAALDDSGRQVNVALDVTISNARDPAIVGESIESVETHAPATQWTSQDVLLLKSMGITFDASVY
jgi:hypothetical protein